MTKKNSSSHRSLANFLHQIAKERNLSPRSIAVGAGVSPGYFSEIYNGKRIPEADVCNRIADFLHVPRIDIYGLAGWLDLSVNEQFIQKAGDFSRNDPEFARLLNEIMSLTNEVEKKRLIRALEFLLKDKADGK
jgi:transcriptional regulator with XRE-family HTH domain